MCKTKLQEETKGEIVFWDTDIITIIIWAKEKFGASNEIFEKSLKENVPHFYLLCNPDLEWEKDNLRENPNDRYRLLKEVPVDSNLSEGFLTLTFRAKVK